MCSVCTDLLSRDSVERQEKKEKRLCGRETFERALSTVSIKSPLPSGARGTPTEEETESARIGRDGGHQESSPLKEHEQSSYDPTETETV